MKTKPAQAKNRKNKQPLEVVKEGSISIPIYVHTNIIPQRDSEGKIIYGPPRANGKRQALIKYESDIFTLAYYEGSRRVRSKFSDLAKARAEAGLIGIKLANGETEALKLHGGDRSDYVRAMQKLREWKPNADLNLAVTDYVSAIRRLPEHISLKEVVDFFLRRHPIGLPVKTVRVVVEELVKSKADAGKSSIYIKDLTGRLNSFARVFEVPIAAVTGAQIETYLRGLGRRARTQNNYRRLIGTLFKFAIRRGYLPRDHNELDGVERADDDTGDIQIFTPDELRKLFAACLTPVQERGKWRDREVMIPYLAIAAFCGLRAAEVARLDWSEVHLTGPEKFIEVKASKSKTASRRTVPIPDNCLAWLLPHAQPSGPVCQLGRPDKQCFHILAPAAGIKWKRNGLRHGYCSYRLAVVKDVGRVALEAGNSAQMIFQHYRQLVREEEASQWFSILPPKSAENVVPMPATEVNAATAG